MDSLTILFIFGALGAAPALLLLSFRGPVQESWKLAAVLAVGFIGLSAVPIARKGYLGFIPALTRELWGIQVWYDLIIAVTVALVFIVPRARAMGMKTTPWVIATAFTGCLALLPMVARLFWLEAHARKPA